MSQQLKDLNADHAEIEGEQPSPYLSDMETYYLSKPFHFSGKIMLAIWIPMETRRHMIAHVRAQLTGRHKERKRVRRVAFRTFIRDPAARKASTSRFNYGKSRNGFWKQSKKTGRFVRYSKAERRVIDANKRRA